MKTELRTKKYYKTFHTIYVIVTASFANTVTLWLEATLSGFGWLDGQEFQDDKFSLML